ncbi:hypothetical protein I656_02035 [Geobacillus sp. WSUCF1]|nr:hypothetical protein I656_02035 [Geobacillus sp. WSUCF1]
MLMETTLAARSARPAEAGVALLTLNITNFSPTDYSWRFFFHHKSSFLNENMAVLKDRALLSREQ